MRRVLYCFVFITLILLPRTAFPNLITNGGFEFPDVTGSYQSYVEVSDLPDGFEWILSFPYVDLINSLWYGVSGTSNPDGDDQSIRLMATGTVYQTFNTTPGQNYKLSFYYSHSPYDSDILGGAGFMALLNGNDGYYFDGYQNPNTILYAHLVHATPNDFSDMKWTQYTIEFAAIGTSTTLAFQTDREYNTVGPFPTTTVTGLVVDRVRLTSVTFPPTADAGSDQAVHEGQEVMLDGSNSSDFHNGIVLYHWTQTAGPAVKLSDTSAVKPTYEAPKVGPRGVTLTFELTITNESGANDTDTCTVVVLDRKPMPWLLLLLDDD